MVHRNKYLLSQSFSLIRDQIFPKLVGKKYKNKTVFQDLSQLENHPTFNGCYPNMTIKMSLSSEYYSTYPVDQHSPEPYSAFSFSHRWNTEKQLWQYSLLDKVYFLVNFRNCHTRVVYWGNTGKYTPSRAGPILEKPVLALLGFYFTVLPQQTTLVWQF